MNQIQVYGADWCPETARVRAFLKEQNIAFEDHDIDISHKTAIELETAAHEDHVFPIVWIEGKRYLNPDTDTLTSVLGINPGYRVQIFSAEWCPDCKRAKAFLHENDINYQLYDIDHHDWAPAFLEKVNNGKRIIPTLLVNGETYANLSNQKIRELLSLPEQDNQKIYDVAIIGGGATGLTAAIYIQRDRFDSIILEKSTIGGNAYKTEKIENYPGFINISGPELMDKMEEQARFYGAEIRQGVEVRGFDRGNNYFSLDTTDGEIKARSIVIATGSTYRLLKIPGEQDLIGSGVHFCATCDGAFYKGKEVLVVGGGNSALEEGIFLSRFVDKVKIVARSPQFSATQAYVEKLPGLSNVETYLNKTPQEFVQAEDGTFKGLKVLNNATGSEELIEADGTFIFIGLIPNTKFFKKRIKLNEAGFIETQPGSVQTSMEGVFAAGDCREGAIAQVAAATGEGVIASYFVRNYLRE